MLYRQLQLRAYIISDQLVRTTSDRQVERLVEMLDEVVSKMRELKGVRYV